MYKQNKIKLNDLIPRIKGKQNYLKKFVEKRQQWIIKKFNLKLNNLFSQKDFIKYKKNIENPIGICVVPVSLVGPIIINGDFAKDKFYVPFATTQGSLIESYQIGSWILNESNGVNTKIIKDQIDIDPVFIFSNLSIAFKFYNWLQNQLPLKEINLIVKKTTSHGKVLEITPYLIGNKVFLQISFYTKDAMGLNLMTIATNNICLFLQKKFPNSYFYLRSNLTSDKKASHINLQSSYGKEVQAEVLIPETILRKYFKIKIQHMIDVWTSCFLGTYQGGVLGHNAHVANAISAIYLATGQDIAQVANASNAITYFEKQKNSLYVNLKISSLPIATVGGGTGLPHQKEALEIIGCVGNDKAKKLAEIICAIALAGEISLIGALANNTFAQTDIKLKER